MLSLVPWLSSKDQHLQDFLGLSLIASLWLLQLLASHLHSRKRRVLVILFFFLICKAGASLPTSASISLVMKSTFAKIDVLFFPFSCLHTYLQRKFNRYT